MGQKKHLPGSKNKFSVTSLLFRERAATYEKIMLHSPSPNNFLFLKAPENFLSCVTSILGTGNYLLKHFGVILGFPNIPVFLEAPERRALLKVRLCHYYVTLCHWFW
jgi:hypothetical protein